MLDSIIQIYRSYRHELKVPNPETYRRSQIRGLVLVGLVSDITFAIAYLVITFIDNQYKDDSLAVAVSVVFFLGVGGMALIDTKLFDKIGAHLLLLLLLAISATLVPHVSSALFLVMLVKVVITSGILTKPIFTWIYSALGFALLILLSFNKYPLVQVFGFLAIYIYVTVAGFLIATMINSLFTMSEQSSSSMKQLYLDDKKLFSSLAHRLKTPVAILRGQLLSNPNTKNDPEILGPLDEITAAINELTVLSKMNLSKAVATKQRLDLRDVLDEVTHDALILAANHERMHGQKRVIKYKPRGFKFSPIVHVAPQQLKEALLNVIDNSIRHNESKQLVNITIDMQVKQKKYCITIQDDGVGMSEEHLRNVLSKYTTVGETDSPIDMHVGLEISRNLIRANGGDLYIYSQPEEGTTVEIILNED